MLQEKKRIPLRPLIVWTAGALGLWACGSNHGVSGGTGGQATQASSASTGGSTASSASGTAGGMSSSSGAGGGAGTGGGGVAPPGKPIYVSQAGAGTDSGQDCADAHSAMWFNDAGNWGSGATQIGPGTVVHVCGTFTGAVGDTALTMQASGTQGMPITVFFEPDAVFTSPAWGGNGAISLGTYSFNIAYVAVNGGQNGVIENTANGTGLAHQQGTRAVFAPNGCDACEVSHLHISNLYVHKSTSDTVVDQTLVNAVILGGASPLIHDNVIHDVGWAISVGFEGSEVYGNEIYNIDHGITVADGKNATGDVVRVHDNYIHDYANWDTDSDAYHHDGIHAFGDGTATLKALWIYGNTFSGDTGDSVTAHVFLEGGTEGTPWTNEQSPGASTLYFFNNVGVLATPVSLSNGIFALYGGGAGYRIYNNTIIGDNATATPASGVCLNTDSPDAAVVNNVMAGCNILWAGTGPSTDYNVYSDCVGQSYNCWWNKYVDTGSFSAYQMASMGADAHGSYVANLMLDSTEHPDPGSPVIGAGKNLTSLAVPGLDANAAGAARPASGAWNAGAY